MMMKSNGMKKAVMKAGKAGMKMGRHSKLKRAAEKMFGSRSK